MKSRYGKFAVLSIILFLEFFYFLMITLVPFPFFQNFIRGHSLNFFPTFFFFFFLGVDFLFFFELQVGLLNVDGYYNSLLALFDKGVEEGFIQGSARQIVVSADTPEELINKMEVYIYINESILL